MGEFYGNAARSDGLSPLCAVHHRERTQASARKQRAEFLEAMGGGCARCGFSDQRALQVDHVHGGGVQKRGMEHAAGGPRLYAFVLAHRDEFQILCANCNVIKRIEEKESVGARDYARVVPTERKRGEGYGNAPGTRAALVATRTSEHQAAAGRAKKGRPQPKVAAVRLGTRMIDGHWVRAEDIPADVKAALDAQRDEKRRAYQVAYDAKKRQRAESA